MKKYVAIILQIVLCTIVVQSQPYLSINTVQVGGKKNPVGVQHSNPFFSWTSSSTQKNILQTGYRVIVADDSNKVKSNIGNCWDTKKVLSNASYQIKYNGKPLQAAKKYFYKVFVWDNKGNVAASIIYNFQMGLLSNTDWLNAQWIAYDTLLEANKIIPAVHGSGKKEWGKRSNILPLMRKQFFIDKKFKNATLFICGLGQFEAYINGTKVGNNFLDPEWTQYNKQAAYVSFNVTHQLHQNQNAIGVILGNGFYYIPSERYRKMTGAFGLPKMIARLQIEFEDGTTNNIVSNSTWKASSSAITFSSIYGGEDYDATLEQENWNTALFNDANWSQAIVTTGIQLTAQKGDGIKLTEQPPEILNKISSKQIGKGIWVFDMLQNHSGIPKIIVQGNRADTIKIITGELLKEDGTVSQKATGSPHYYKYILKGGIAETFIPKFSYYGFRYIQVENVSFKDNDKELYPKLLAVNMLNSSAATKANTVQCSNTLVQNISSLILQAVESNFQSIFTDCPTREKLGWLEQLHLMGNSMQLHYNIQNISHKILNDIKIEQEPSGLIPSTIPEYTKMHFANGWFRDSPEWGSTGIILPWYLYKWYGDKNALVQNYTTMQRYINYLKTKDSSNLLMYGLSDWYDLGSNKPGFCQLTPMGLTATAYYYYDLTILQNTAKVLGKTNDANMYAAWAQKVKASFNSAYYNSTTKQYGTGSQTANAMAVFMQLVNKNDEPAVIENIIKNIRNNNNSFTSGDIGFRYLLQVLHNAGRSDVIYDMNIRTDVPGYGYQIAKGATALTESWQALPTVSNNHLMLGHILEWFVEGLVGIQQSPQSIAYKSIVIKPAIVKNITSAAFAYNSVYGLVNVDWKIVNNSFEISIDIPVNTTATVHLPANANNKIVEIQDNKIYKPIKFKNGYAILKVGSGKYNFLVK